MIKRGRESERRERKQVKPKGWVSPQVEMKPLSLGNGTGATRIRITSRSDFFSSPLLLCTLFWFGLV